MATSTPDTSPTDQKTLLIVDGLKNPPISSEDLTNKNNIPSKNTYFAFYRITLKTETKIPHKEDENNLDIQNNRISRPEKSFAEKQSDNAQTPAIKSTLDTNKHNSNEKPKEK